MVHLYTVKPLLYRTHQLLTAILRVLLSQRRLQRKEKKRAHLSLVLYRPQIMPKLVPAYHREITNNYWN